MEFPENRLSEADNSCRTPDCGGERREPAADGGFFVPPLSRVMGLVEHD